MQLKNLIDVIGDYTWIIINKDYAKVFQGYTFEILDEELLKEEVLQVDTLHTNNIYITVGKW